MSDEADDLLHMFQSMGTSDREMLAVQFTNIVSCDSDSSLFFLEANNWNLQAAIASYYESGNTELYEAQQHPPEMGLLADLTIDSKDQMGPNAPFRQTWRVANTGQTHWPHGTRLVHVSGHLLPGPRSVEVPPLLPHEATNVTIALRSPSEPGSYASAWRLCCSQGVELYFGELMWIVLHVQGGGRGEACEAEIRRLEIQRQHELDALEDAFSSMNSFGKSLGDASKRPGGAGMDM